MSAEQKFSPKLTNIDKPCLYWSTPSGCIGCNFPKREIYGRTSCEGIIDFPCLLVTRKLDLGVLTPEQMEKFRFQVPELDKRPQVDPEIDTPDIR